MPARSQAQRAFIFATKGEAFARKHHFDNRGKLPAHAPKRKGKKSSRHDLYAKFAQKQVNHHG
jgi:hypothetical protein